MSWVSTKTKWIYCENVLIYCFRFSCSTSLPGLLSMSLQRETVGENIVLLVAKTALIKINNKTSKANSSQSTRPSQSKLKTYLGEAVRSNWKIKHWTGKLQLTNKLTSLTTLYCKTTASNISKTWGDVKDHCRLYAHLLCLIWTVVT